MKCYAEDCIYNAGKECVSDLIRISPERNDAYCDTYLSEGGVKPKIFRHDAEFGGEWRTPQVLCTASRCVYNKAFRCCAKDLRIEAPQGSNICACGTYRSK